MFKVFIFGRKRADLSSEEFRNTYEKEHVMWSKDLREAHKVPPTLKYHRNYLLHDNPNNIGGPLDFDSVTEACFESEEAWKASRLALQAPDVAPLVRENLAKFMDPDSLRYVVVNEFDEKGRQLA
jgi:EthD domain